MGNADYLKAKKPELTTLEAHHRLALSEGQKEDETKKRMEEINVVKYYHNGKFNLLDSSVSGDAVDCTSDNNSRHTSCHTCRVGTIETLT